MELNIFTGKRVDILATDIDTDGFKINVGSTDSALVQASISWIAISKDSGCLIGNYSYLVSLESHAGDASSCSFPDGKFSKPPKVLAGFSSFDISGSSDNPRFGTNMRDITTNGFNWNIYTWGESAITSARVEWIAIPAE